MKPGALCVHNAQVKQISTRTWNELHTDHLLRMSEYGPFQKALTSFGVSIFVLWVALSLFGGLKGTKCENTLEEDNIKRYHVPLSSSVKQFCKRMTICLHDNALCINMNQVASNLVIIQYILKTLFFGVVTSYSKQKICKIFNIWFQTYNTTKQLN